MSIHLEKNKNTLFFERHCHQSKNKLWCIESKRTIFQTYEKIVRFAETLMETLWLAPSHSSVWGVCVCTVSAGVVCTCAWSVCKYIYIYISHIYTSLFEFQLQLGLSRVQMYPWPNEGAEPRSWPGRGWVYIHTHHGSMHYHCWGSLQCLHHIETECEWLYINSTTTQDATTITALSLLEPSKQPV